MSSNYWIALGDTLAMMMRWNFYDVPVFLLPAHTVVSSPDIAIRTKHIKNMTKSDEKDYPYGIYLKEKVVSDCMGLSQNPHPVVLARFYF
jgi:hypothetical protein